MSEALALNSTKLSFLSAPHLLFDAFHLHDKLQTVCLFEFMASGLLDGMPMMYSTTCHTMFLLGV